MPLSHEQRTIKSGILEKYKTEFLIVLLGMVAYFVCLINDFHTDDWMVLRLLGDGMSWKELFSMENPGRFRPLSNLILYLRFLVFGDRPAGYYALNVLLHIGFGLLLYRFLKKLGLPQRACLFSALIFTVYYQHYEAVIWLYGVLRVLAGFFLIMSLWALHGYIETRRPFLFWAFAASSFMGLFTVEDFAVAPLAFAIFVYLTSDKDGRRAVAVRVVAVNVLSLAVYFGLRGILISRPGIIERYYFIGPHILKQLFSYLGWMVIPSPDHPYFHRFAVGLKDGLYALWKGINYLSMILFIPVGIYLYRKLPKQLGFFVALILITLTPVLPLTYKVSSRNIYLPSIGMSVIVGYLLYLLFRVAEKRSWVKVPGVVVTTLYIGVSITSIWITSLEYRRTQTLVAGMVEDLKRATADYRSCQYVLLDHMPGRTILGPAMMYRLAFDGNVVASNDPVAGDIDIAKVVSDLTRQGISFVVFDYRHGHLVEATAEYLLKGQAGVDRGDDRLAVSAEGLLDSR